MDASVGNMDPCPRIFGTQTRAEWDRTTNLPVSRSPALPPELSKLSKVTISFVSHFINADDKCGTEQEARRPQLKVKLAQVRKTVSGHLYCF